MKLYYRLIIFPFLYLLSSALPSVAFQLHPMSKTFAPAGTQATQSYEIINDGKEKVAIEMSVVTRQMELNGAETYQDANQDFLIYPPQILLKPGEVQAVQVTWLGNPQPKEELAYRLVAKQLPIDLTSPSQDVAKPVGQLRVLMSYMGSLYIRPTNTKPNVVLQSIALQKNAKGTSEIVLMLKNEGTARAALRKFNLSLKFQSGTVVELHPEQLKEINNQVILAGHTRRFVISLPKELPNEPITASFDFAKEE